MSARPGEVSGSASSQLPALHYCRSMSSCCSNIYLQLSDSLGLHLIIGRTEVLLKQSHSELLPFKLVLGTGRQSVHSHPHPAAEQSPGAEQAVRGAFTSTLLQSSVQGLSGQCACRSGRCWEGCPPRTRRSCRTWPWSCAKSAATRCAARLGRRSHLWPRSHALS